MSYEYYFVPKNVERAFPPEAVAAMQARLETFPTYVWKDGTYLLFRSEEDRAMSLAWLRKNPSQNDYLTASIHIDSKEVTISSVLESTTDRMFYNFVTWCQQSWPGELYYEDEPLSPAELLAESLPDVIELAPNGSREISPEFSINGTTQTAQRTLSLEPIPSGVA